MTLSKWLIGLLLFACDGLVVAQTTVVTCRLGKNMHETVSVIADQPIADSQVILFGAPSDGLPHPIFGDENDASRGARVKVRCVGKEEKVLVLVGEFLGSGYPRGVAVRFNKGQFEQLEFAEPALPDFVDLSPSEMRLAFSQHGPEIAAAFAVYTYVSGTGPLPEVKEADRIQRPVDGVRIPVQP